MVFHNSFLSLHENGMTITALDADRQVILPAKPITPLVVVLL